LWLALEMKRNLLLVFLAAFVALSCQSTKLIDTWTPPKGYSGVPYGRLMIVGLGANPEGRAHYENAFVDKLRNYGVTAVASANVVPRIKDIDRETVESWLTELEFTGVIVTRVTTTEPPRRYVPLHVNLGGWYGAWGMDSEVVPWDEKFFLETDLFDARTEELRYSAVIQANIKKGRRETINAVIDVLATDMVKRGYFPHR
jgi:hypothetical protein